MRIFHFQTKTRGSINSTFIYFIFLAHIVAYRPFMKLIIHAL